MAGFAGYKDVQEWRQATFGSQSDLRATHDAFREGGFGGYASKADWERATFSEPGRPNFMKTDPRDERLERK